MTKMMQCNARLQAKGSRLDFITKKMITLYVNLLFLKRLRVLASPPCNSLPT